MLSYGCCCSLDYKLDIRGYFDPLALRKAKIAYNFGLSECSRVKISVFKITGVDCNMTKNIFPISAFSTRISLHLARYWSSHSALDGWGFQGHILS